MNWADLDFSTPISTLPKASNFFEPSKSFSPVHHHHQQQSIPTAKKKSTTASTTTTLPGKKNRCYTCKPRGKVKKHVICNKNDVIFHFDLHKRPLILVTPMYHYTSFFEMPTHIIQNILMEIKQFCEDWNIKDYQCSWNNGKWQKHKHVHVKIRLSEKIINRLRRDHFTKLKLERMYALKMKLRG